MSVSVTSLRNNRELVPFRYRLDPLPPWAHHSVSAAVWTARRISPLVAYIKASHETKAALHTRLHAFQPLHPFLLSTFVFLSSSSTSTSTSALASNSTSTSFFKSTFTTEHSPFFFSFPPPFLFASNLTTSISSSSSSFFYSSCIFPSLFLFVFTFAVSLLLPPTFTLVSVPSSPAFPSRTLCLQSPTNTHTYAMHKSEHLNCALTCVFFLSNGTVIYQA
ncbi:hypothetical transcript [Echinococcus multilocularis]|uniref:Hypothetical transcript n=1 Tax=Echinococcus multilocularis TaxID=6211 RepID=A0A068Y161_ECHMU|nr:hypothetical transcript [Echinococcus multilocularis]